MKNKPIHSGVTSLMIKYKSPVVTDYSPDKLNQMSLFLDLIWRWGSYFKHGNETLENRWKRLHLHFCEGNCAYLGISVKLTNKSLCKCFYRSLAKGLTLTEVTPPFLSTIVGLLVVITGGDSFLCLAQHCVCVSRCHMCVIHKKHVGLDV